MDPHMVHNQNTSEDYQREIMDFCGFNLEGSYNVSIWFFLVRALKRSLVFLHQIYRPNFDSLAESLCTFRMTSGETWKYDQIFKQFISLFPGIKFEALEDKTIGSRERPFVIKITEKSGREFRLQDSAGGYYQALCIFSELVSRNKSVLVLDEPIMHLHPTKIRRLANILSENKVYGNQIILTTHSPYFVDVSLFKKCRTLICIRKDIDNLTSTVVNKPSKFNLRLKSHHFNPDIFFNNVSIFVEGPGDESALTAISDNLDDVFKQEDILVVNVGGVENVKPYIDLIKAYKIEHVIMVDAHYNKALTKDTIKLQGDLEDEMTKIGWSVKKLTPQEAYDHISMTMKRSKNKVKNSTNLANVFDKALTKVGIEDPSKVWSKRYYGVPKSNG
ncbi:MAG: AAA family ATPase [Candidatus Nitrosopolaris sp.]